MMTNLFDYEMLARQKYEAMQAEVTQRRMETQLAQGRTSGFLVRIRAIRVRFGAFR